MSTSYVESYIRVFLHFGAGPLDPDGGPSGQGHFAASLRAEGSGVTSLVSTDVREWAVGGLAALVDL